MQGANHRANQKCFLRTNKSLLPHEAIATTARKQSLLPHEAIATAARSNRYYRTKQSLLPHEAIATTARSHRYYRTKQSLLPHKATAPTAQSNRYYRTKPSLLPHEAIAPTAQSHRSYRTKQSLLPHKAIAPTARSHRYYRTKQSLLPHKASLLPYGQNVSCGPSVGCGRTNRAAPGLPHRHQIPAILRVRFARPAAPNRHTQADQEVFRCGYSIPSIIAARVKTHKTVSAHGAGLRPHLRGRYLQQTPLHSRTAKGLPCPE